MARPIPPLRDILRTRAEELGAPMEVLEKDYALSYLLAGIYGNEDLRSCLVFKGGTALRKAYFGDYRFSVDLDFTAVGGPRGHGLETAIFDAAARAQHLLRERGPFSATATRRPEKAPHPGFQEAFQVQVGFPWHSRPVCSLKIEISADETLALAPADRLMLHAYEEDLVVTLRCYPIEEIAAEKLRTPAQVQARLDQGKWPRNCARDYYDLWRLFTLSQSEFDRKAVASILSKKCDARGVSIHDAQDIFPRFVVAEAERQWSSSLADLVTPLPAFAEVMSQLRDLVRAFLAPPEE